MADHSEQARATLTELREEAADRLETTSRMLATLLADRAGANDDDEHDPDGATLSAEWSRLTGLEDAARTKLKQVDDALTRLDAGTYGICIGCGKPIPAGRLEARPFAERCVPCTERLAR